MSSVTTRSGPVWLDDGAVPPAPPMDRNRKTDVCVVGAGIAGLSTAYLLARAGRKVVVLDDGAIAGGQTLLTTAHVSSVPDDRYETIKKIHGVQGARLVADALSSAIDRIESTVNDEHSDCAFRRLDAFLFAEPRHDAGELDREFAAARETGVIQVERAGRAPIPSFDTGSCLCYRNQAQFQPIRYLAALAEAIRRHGGEIYGDTHVTAIHGGNAAFVETHYGNRVDANSLVVATNSPVNDRMTMHTKQAPYISYVIAARVPRDAVPFALYWDTNDPFHYVRLHRPCENHAAEDLLIIGGEDHKSGQAQDGERRFARLEHWARERFPEILGVEHRWAGQVLESNDALPFIGRNPSDHDNVFIATGFSGLGMTNGTLAGMIISDLIRGRENRWSELYDPARKVKSFSSLREFVKENLNVAGQYTALLTPGEVRSTDEIALGEGAVLRRGVRKLAVYRDVSGRIFEMSAICPHLGCVVQWNSTEKTWDCPCHGSRFDAQGGVINGPSNCNLERVACYATTND